MTFNPAIVVVAYNRTRSLERLLFSLKKIKKLPQVRLIISIDNKEPENLPVLDLAEAFEWPFGEKEVIYQEKRLGLRNHILKCGDLTEKHGSVIILEDDLFVSPFFYDYAVKALEFYQHDQNIAGISLYGQPREDITELPFSPVNDGSDVFFLQFPSSWGQAWSHEQWTRFRKWYDFHADISQIPISQVIHRWPESSWKKYFAAYLNATNRFFVYPRISLTTNFNDPGTNYKRLINFDGQAPLRMEQLEYNLINLSDSFSVYDSYFELIPDCVKKLTPELKEFNFDMDLYGNKNIENINTPLVITKKKSNHSLKGFSRSLKPHDMNIIFNLPGDDFALCDKSNVILTSNSTARQVHDFKYFFTRHIPSKKVFLFKYLSKYGLYKYFVNQDKKLS